MLQKKKALHFSPKNTQGIWAGRNTHKRGSVRKKLKPLNCRNYRPGMPSLRMRSDSTAAGSNRGVTNRKVVLCSTERGERERERKRQKNLPKCVNYLGQKMGLPQPPQQKKGEKSSLNSRICVDPAQKSADSDSSVTLWLSPKSL